MHIDHIHPDHSCDLSLAPIDCGFDPRVHGMRCAVPETATRVGYEREGEARIVSGTIDEIADELRAAGYAITIFSETDQ